MVIDNDYWCIRQIIKGEKLNDKKLINRNLRKLIRSL